MAVVLRLRRMGRRNRPFYRICAIERSHARDGKYIESIGWYNPLSPREEEVYSLKKDRAEYWLSVGARPSETVLSILKRFDVKLPEFIFRSKSARQRLKKKRKKAEKGKVSKSSKGKKKG